MAYVKINMKIAKDIGAFPAKLLSLNAKPGEYVIECHHTKVVKVTGNEDPHGFSKNYYKKPTDKVILSLCADVHELDNQIEAWEARIKELKEKKEALQETIQKDFVFGEFKTKIVLEYYRKYNEDFNLDDLGLRDGDTLVNIGRYSNININTYYAAHWVVIIEIPGVITNEVNKNYVKVSHGWNDDHKAFNIHRFEDTVYKKGEFSDHVSHIIK